MENADEKFQSPGDKNIEQKTYLESMNEPLRSEAIDTCSRFNEAVPEAVAMGGMALRFQYEAKTGQPMFGVGQGDYDFYVPMDKLQELSDAPPDGYRTKRPEEFMPPGKTLEPHHRALEDTKNYAHMDLFGTSEERRSEQLTIDGKTIRVLSVDEIVADQAGIIARDLTRNGMVDERRKFYAQKLQEIIAATPDTATIDDAWQRENARMETAITEGVERLKTDAGSSFAEKARQALDEATAQGDKNAAAIREAIQNLDANEPNYAQQFEGVVLEQRMAQYRRGWRELLADSNQPKTKTANRQDRTGTEKPNQPESLLNECLDLAKEIETDAKKIERNDADFAGRAKTNLNRLTRLALNANPKELGYKPVRRMTDEIHDALKTKLLAMEKPDERSRVRHLSSSVEVELTAVDQEQDPGKAQIHHQRALKLFTSAVDEIEQKANRVSADKKNMGRVTEENRDKAGNELRTAERMLKQNMSGSIVDAYRRSSRTFADGFGQDIAKSEKEKRAILAQLQEKKNKIMSLLKPDR